MLFKAIKTKSKSYFVPGVSLVTKSVMQPMVYEGLFFENLGGSSPDHFHYQEAASFMKSQHKYPFLWSARFSATCR